MKSNMLTMAVSLTAIAAAMGAALGVVHEVTLQPIEQAQEQAKQEALASVLPKLPSLTAGEAVEVTASVDARPVLLYPAYSEGQPCGAAVETWTMDGFSGEITVMVGFALDGAVTGYKVLQSAETPGLGAKASEWFAQEVEQCGEGDANSGASKKTQRSIIGTNEMLKVSKDGGQIDAITAATITSRAFLGAVNRARAAYQEYLNLNAEAQ